jgi:CRISPR/Cas system-associated endonuclease Cas3-HD
VSSWSLHIIMKHWHQFINQDEGVINLPFNIELACREMDEDINLLRAENERLKAGWYGLHETCSERAREIGKLRALLERARRMLPRLDLGVELGESPVNLIKEIDAALGEKK